MSFLKVLYEAFISKICNGNGWIGEIISNTNNNKEGIQLRDEEEISAKVR